MPPLLPTLQTQRLVLRKPRPEDAAPLFTAYGQDAEVARFMVWRPQTRVDETEEFLQGCLASWDEGTRAPYVLTRLGDDRLIGMLEARFHGHMVDIGYVLEKRQWRQGLMTEAISALVDDLLARETIFRLQATCDVDNIASALTLQKSGFRREGRLERYTVHPNISPEPRACYMYARCRGAA